MPQPVDAVRRVAVLVVATVALIFMALVTLAAVPPTSVSADAAPATDRLRPFFAQDWQLFAPNPLDADRVVRFQAAYRSAGTVRRTPWLDWTDVELDLVRRRLVGGRAGYVSNKMWSLAQTAVVRAGAGGREVLTAPTSDRSATDATTTRASLLSAGVPSSEADSLAAYDEAITTLATQALRARHPGLDVVAVRYELSLRPVVPYGMRDASTAARRSLSARTVVLLGGWRRPAPGRPAAARAVADFERWHR